MEESTDHNLAVPNLFEKVKELKEAYIFEFQKVSELRQHKELIFQFFVDMCQLGLEIESSVQILVGGDDSIVQNPKVIKNFPAQGIDYIRNLNTIDIYEVAGVPFTRDYPDYKPNKL